VTAILAARGAGGPSAGANGHRGGSGYREPKINENPVGLAPRSRETATHQKHSSPKIYKKLRRSREPVIQ